MYKSRLSIVAFGIGISIYSPLRHWKVGKGHKVGVLGLGGLGHMAVKLAASFGAEVTMLSGSPSKETDAKRLGAHHFVLTSDDAAMNRIANHFNFIVNTVSAPHDYSKFLNTLDTDGNDLCRCSTRTDAHSSLQPALATS